VTTTSDRINALCEDGTKRSVHGVYGSEYVYASGRRVYGFTRYEATIGAWKFYASSTAKHRHLIQPAIDR